MKPILFALATVVAALPATASVNPDSPIFSARNAVHVSSLDQTGFLYCGLKTLDGGAEYPTAATAATAQAPAQSPASADVTSFCIGSWCLGSFCLGSGCGTSFCIGSACGTSKCAGSFCSNSVCGGSGCAISVCGGSVCLGSACAGSLCLTCKKKPKTESFPLVDGCDYELKDGQVTLTLVVAREARIRSGAADIVVPANRVKAVRLAGTFKSVTCRTSAAAKVELVLQDERGHDLTLPITES